MSYATINETRKLFLAKRRTGRRRWNALSIQMWLSKRYARRCGRHSPRQHHLMPSSCISAVMAYREDWYAMMASSIILPFWTSWGRARLCKRWHSWMLAMQGKWGAQTREAPTIPMKTWCSSSLLAPQRNPWRHQGKQVSTTASSLSFWNEVCEVGLTWIGTRWLLQGKSTTSCIKE